ncbi:ankyrin repeat protein (macronuclear) [Tetrahymena thermophila SB210]|uniref:Ankyrin repeat protein n=1 Tax=Tetrahymena thermophila (strain SB210) TaxID=312017 RepID=I7MMT3_TETTS|nr:ankyrin repeat protein [Tetrahymena thermophila SB210]EAS06700.2 ankyrin repeat protein [Tetrahymena thermophila SB210]|eukprot:XP_001026942.2 ankyrin repeat protein [Tetrahymena thermophila SB210]
MELFKNAKISNSESKLESKIGIFSRVSSANKIKNIPVRSTSAEQIQKEPQLNINQLYTNKELTKLKKTVKKNPFDPTAQLFMREIRRQEAKQNSFQRDENNFMNRTTFRSDQKRNFSSDDTCKTKSQSCSNINNVSRQTNVHHLDQSNTVQNIKLQVTNTSKIQQDNLNIQPKFLNKNMGAQFTTKGSARNFECLKYRMVMFQEYDKAIEQKKQKNNNSFKMISSKSQPKALKQQLTSALVQLKEFQDQDEMDKAVTIVSKGINGSEIQQSQQHKNTVNLEENEKSTLSRLFTQSGSNSIHFNKPSFKNQGIEQLKKNMQDESPWVYSTFSRQNMINQVKEINKQLYQKRSNSACQQQKSQFSINTMLDQENIGKINITQQENNQNEQNANNLQNLNHQKIDPEDRPVYFDVNTGKRTLGVTENERKMFASFLADKNLNVLLYSRKFDVEPNGHLQKHLQKLNQQNQINQQIRDKFNQQMLDSQIKREQQKINQELQNKHLYTDEATPSMILANNNTSNFLWNKSNNKAYNSPSNHLQESQLPSSRCSSKDQTPRTPGTITNLVSKMSKNQFISINEFLKQNEQTGQFNSQKSQESSSVLKAKKINSLINQQTQNLLEMKQISFVKQQSSSQNNVSSPQSNMYIPLNSEYANQAMQTIQEKNSFNSITDPSPIIGGMKSISPIKNRGESTIKFSSYNQIIEGNLQDLQSKSETNQSPSKNANFTYFLKMRQQELEENQAFIGFLRSKSNSKNQNISSEPQIRLASGSLTNTSRKQIKIKQHIQGSQTTRNYAYPNSSLAHIPETTTMNQISQQSLGQRSKTIIIQHLKKSQELLNSLFPTKNDPQLEREQQSVLLDKYKYLVPSEKITKVNLKKERRKQKGISQKLPKKIFDDQGIVFGRNPFLKFKSSKLMKIRLNLVKYLQKVKHLNINIYEIVEKKIFPLNPYERPGAYIFLNLCKNGTSIQIEEVLKQNQYHVNDFNELNQTGLIIAAYHNNLEACLVLLKYFSDPDIIDSTNKTALYYALKNKNHQLVRYLFFYRASPWSRQIIKYSEIQMDEEMRQIFEIARVVHFMILLPYNYDEQKLWEVFLKDPLPELLPESQNGSQQDSQSEIENQTPNYSFLNQQNSKQTSSLNHNKKSVHSIADIINQKYASISSSTPLNEYQSINSMQKLKNDDKDNKFEDEQEIYYGDLFKKQNYS